ncbi:MAG: TIGR02281 family clan AA aspartic protease [Rhizobiaceae bacterium]|nr:TIGR02281 family clan AA aspartic protease [Rhizobiaceae bacterium]
MLRLAITFAGLVLFISWVSAGREDGARLHEFARWATSPAADSEVASTVSTVEAVRAEQAPLGRKVIIPAGSNGQFESQFRLNNRYVTALVDTGATLVAINMSTAVRAGIKLKHSDFQHEVQTANGPTLAATAIIDSIDIGRIHIKDVEALVLHDSALQTTLVGMSFLRRLESFQVQDHTLLLVQ